MQITRENVDQFFRSIDEKYHTESIQYENEYDGMFAITIHQLPTKVKYFVIDQAYKLLEYRDEYINTLIEMLYKNILEYRYIPKYRDGYHIDVIHDIRLELEHWLYVSEMCEIGDTIYQFIRSYFNYEESYKKARDHVNQAIIEEQRINKDPDISIDLIPEEIPVELWLENLIDGKFAHIFNDYKPANCDEDMLFLP